jgi:hypothetical protein
MATMLLDLVDPTPVKILRATDTWMIERRESLGPDIWASVDMCKQELVSGLIVDGVLSPLVGAEIESRRATVELSEVITILETSANPAFAIRLAGNVRGFVETVGNTIESVETAHRASAETSPSAHAQPTFSAHTHIPPRARPGRQDWREFSKLCQRSERQVQVAGYGTLAAFKAALWWMAENGATNSDLALIRQMRQGIESGSVDPDTPILRLARGAQLAECLELLKFAEKATKDRLYRDARIAKQELVRRFMRQQEEHLDAPTPNSFRNILGVGIGVKETNGQLTDTVCVKVFVERKFARTQIDTRFQIPATLNDIPTDVDETGPIQASLLPHGQRRHRPAAGGMSVGHYRIGAGTIGAVVRDSGKDNGRRYILSNNHVLADCNNALLGDAIYQPGPGDNGTVADQIATLARSINLDFALRAYNLVDCAIAQVDEPKLVSSDIYGVGSVTRTIRPEIGMSVMKYGRTTQLTHGTIDTFEADIRVDYLGRGRTTFRNVFAILGTAPGLPFSAAGDSGALIVDDQQRACALLFATARNKTFVQPIRRVLRKLGVRLA